MSRPQFVKQETVGERSLLEIRSMIHPCIAPAKSKMFVPNDTVIKTSFTDEHEEGDGLSLVTGPNMGGKSTILR